MHAQMSCYRNTVAEELIERLNDVTTPSLDSFFLATTGSEAVEGAVRLARQATGKTNIIAFQGGYHGRCVPSPPDCVKAQGRCSNEDGVHSILKKSENGPKRRPGSS